MQDWLQEQIAIHEYATKNGLESPVRVRAIDLQEQRQIERQRAIQAREEFVHWRSTPQHEIERRRKSLKPTMPPHFRAVGVKYDYDDVPVVQPIDLGYIDDEEKLDCVRAFERACSDVGEDALPIVHANIVSSPPPTLAFLQHGLTLAFSASNVEAATALLNAGAPVVRDTAAHILDDAPADKQIPLLELLLSSGRWTPNMTTKDCGTTLLLRLIDEGKITLIRWFLEHGADPNLGSAKRLGPHNVRDARCSADALEHAARRGSAEIVKLLLDAGAIIQNGTPLHVAAGLCPPGTNPHAGPVRPSKDFDESQIPVMELLVERGADVNEPDNKTNYVVPRYVIVGATMAGAVQRVRWLLDHGADPDLRGGCGSARQYALITRSEEMKALFEQHEQLKT